MSSKGLTSEAASLLALRAENERLIALLEANGIEWRLARGSVREATHQVR